MWNPLRIIRYHWLRLVRLRGDPFYLARGIGLGVFVGLTPTIPLHAVLLVLFTTLGRGNPFAALLASLMVSNPFTIPAHYFAAWKLGTFFTEKSLSWAEVQNIMNRLSQAELSDDLIPLITHTFSLMWPVLLGGFILAVPLGVAAYFLALKLYILRQKRRLKKIITETESRK